MIWLGLLNRMPGFRLLALIAIIFAVSGCSEDVSIPEQKDVPQLLQATPGDGEVSLTWIEVKGASGYTVYWNTGQAATASLSKYTGQPIVVSDPSYVHQGLNNGTNYRYVVTATTSNGESRESNLAEAQPQRTPPAKPSAVLIKAENERVTLRWIGVNRAERYDLIWDTNSTFTSSRRIQDISSPYVHTGLSNGQTFYYQLLAVNSGGEIASEILNATPNPRLPNVPSDLSITVQNNAIELSWVDVSNADSYELFWSSTPGVNAQDNVIRGVTAPYTHAPVIDGQTYYYRLRASNAFGRSGLSGEMQATVNSIGSEVLPSAGTPPQVPAGLMLAVGNGQLDITWQLRQGATGYNLYWATESTPGIPPSIDTQSNKIANISPPYTHMGLTNGERYYYRVSAISDAGESPLTSMASQIPEVLQPGVPGNVTAVGGDGFIAIRWNRVRDAQTYTLYYRPEGGTATAVANLAQPLYQINGLNNGSLYYLQVTSTHAQSGESARSVELLITPQVDPVASPVGVQVIPGDAEVKLQFDVSAYADLVAGKAVQTYRVYTSTTPGVLSGGNYVNVDVASIQGTMASFTHTNLTNGRRYYYSVSAVNAGGESPRSREVWGQPQVAVPGAPQNIQVTEGDTELALAWQAPEGIPPTNYNVYWSQTLSNGQRTQPVVIPNVGNQLSPGQFQFVITGLINNTDYYVHVKAFNEGGEGLSSSELGAVPHVIEPNGVPTTLTAQAQPNQVTVSWDWDSSTQGTVPPHYRLYWSTQATIDLQNTPWVDAVQSGYVHKGLSNGQAYYYRVAAQNDGGIGPVSSVLQAVPLPDAPGQVSGLQVQGSDQAVIVSWDEVPEAVNYFVYWTTNPTQSLDSWNQLSGMISGDQHKSLSNGITYYYVVTAANQGGESDSSLVANATPQIPASAAPQGLAATAGNTQAILNWSTETGLTYNVYWVNNGIDDPFTQGQVFTNVRPAFTHAGLTNNSVYRYVVTANNAGGESAPSQIVSATPQALQTGAPRTLAAQSGDGQVTLSWQPAPAATVNTRYTLYVGDSPGAGTSGTAVANVSSPYVHSGLTNGNQYYYVVTAIEDVESAASNQATARPMPPEPTVPVGLVAIAGDTVINLRWNASQNATSYTLFWDTVPDFSSSNSILLGDVRNYQHTSRSNGLSYFYRLKAHNGPSDSAYSYTVNATPIAPVVNTPPQVQIVSPAAGVTITVGQSVDFQSTATDVEDDANGRSLVYQWDFGTGSGVVASQLQNPGLRRFQTPGSYAVTVTVTDGDGASSVANRSITVLENQAPASSITLPTQNVSINAGTSVNFSGQGQDSDNHLPLSYIWNFGDNSGISNSNQAVPGERTYNFPGTYLVRFTVADSLGLSDPTPAVITVTVNAPPNVQIDSPSQDMDISQGQSIDFQATAIDPEDGINGLIYQWDFGPGSGLSPSILQDPGVLVFNNFGSHQVTLTVTDQNGAQSQVTRTITVSGSNQVPEITSPVPVSGVHAISMDEDNSPTAYTPFILTAADPEAQNMTWSIAPLPSPQPQLGVPSFSNTATNGTTTTLNYAANADAYGVDTFDVQVADILGGIALLRIQITINAQNDLPSITTNQLTISEGETLVLNSIPGQANLEANDVDNTPAQLIYNVVSVNLGQFELVSDLGVAISSFTQQQVLDQQVQFVHINGDPEPSYSLSIEDSSGIASAANSGTINFTAVPDTTPDPFSFSDQAGVPINTVLTSNTITITGINRAAPISINGGEYAIDSGTFTTIDGTITSGQTVVVRLTSPATLSSTNNAVLTIGGVVDTFSVSTIPADTIPDAFTFVDQTAVPLNSLIDSTAIVVSGINNATSISIVGGSYSIDGGPFTGLNGTVNNAQSVTVRLSSSALSLTATTATLTIGGVSSTFTVTTGDSIPDAFTFVDQTAVPLNSLIDSAAIVVSGINIAAPISIVGGSYSIDGGPFTGLNGTVNNAQSITVRLSSSTLAATATTASLTIGGVSSTFTVTTGGDTVPDLFVFTDQTNAPLDTQVVSNAITVAGINTATNISIAGGEYSIDGGAYTSGSGTINNAQSVTVRLTTSTSGSTPTTATLTIGGVAGVFTVTTQVDDGIPNPFYISSVNSAQLSTLYTSNTITISDINIAVPISISGGFYSIDGAAFTDLAGTVTNGQTVRIQQTSSALYETQTVATLTIGGVSGTYVVTTRGYTVGGTVTGLLGTTLVLRNNGIYTQYVTTDGAFTFSPITNLSPYNVTVDTQPTEPNQICGVTNGSGTISSADVTNVQIVCVTVNYTINVNVSGLTGNGLALQINGAEILNISTIGDFAFITQIPDLSPYDITISSQPVGETCVINNSYGTPKGANVIDVKVLCNPTAVSVEPAIRPIQENQGIVFTFDKSMNPASLIVGGDMQAGGTFVWGTAVVPNDTLTFTPITTWDLGVNHTLTIDADNTLGQAIITQTLGFDVFNLPLYFASTSAVDDTGDGLTPATALRSLQSAITVAVSPAIIVANVGEYTVGLSTPVTLREGVSLYGGYGRYFEDRNLTRHESKIVNTSTTSSSTMQAGLGITSITTVDGFTINAGETVAVNISGGAMPHLRNNTINGGRSNGFTYGIQVSASNPIIENNTILGGTGNGIAHGVYVSAGGIPVIRENLIVGGKGNGFTYAIRSVDSSFQANNNILIGGGGNGISYGVYSTGISSPIIRNNTINAGTGFGINYGISILSGNTPFVDNNFIYDPRGDDTCILLNGATTGFSSLRNNDIYSCTIMYQHIVDSSGCAVNDICPTTIDEINLLPASSNNISVNPLFQSEGGADNDIATPLDNDWHFSITSPVSATTGGLNGVDDGGWGFNLDKDGVTRPLSGSPWSIGPYEP